jgi:hypothetical protein
MASLGRDHERRPARLGAHTEVRTGVEKDPDDGHVSFFDRGQQCSPPALALYIGACSSPQRPLDGGQIPVRGVVNEPLRR